MVISQWGHVWSFSERTIGKIRYVRFQSILQSVRSGLFLFLVICTERSLEIISPDYCAGGELQLSPGGAAPPATLRVEWAARERDRTVERSGGSLCVVRGQPIRRSRFVGR